MPIYVYRCKKCGYEFEKLHRSIWSEPLKVCPKCGGELERVMSPANIIFKGDGFYVTDYKNKKRR